MKIFLATDAFFVGEGYQTLLDKAMPCPYSRNLFSEELPTPLSRHHKGMKIPSSPPGLTTFPLSNFWREGLRG
jgi:hypothetical protein